MPGFLLHVGAQVFCSHLGQAQPVNPYLRVTVSGQPIVTRTGPYAVAGCTFPAMTSGVQPPCLTAQWVSSATRVVANRVPILLMDSKATCVPTGTPLVVSLTQIRLTGA